MDQQILDKALYQAAEAEDLEAARSLLDRGANPNVVGFSWYNCALQAAARRESVELVQLLLDRGAHIDAEGGYHGTGLIGAAQYGRLDIVKLLVNAQANLNLRSGYGTALAVARDKNFKEVVEVLLTAGATEWRPSAKDVGNFYYGL